MQKYVCKVCGHVYDPAENNNVAFEDLPDDWVCPLCGGLNLSLPTSFCASWYTFCYTSRWRKTT